MQEVKTIKCLEKKKTENICDIRLGQDFLNNTSKA